MPSPESCFLMVAVWNVLAAQLRLIPVGMGALANVKSALTRIIAFLDEEELVKYVQESNEGMGNVLS